MGLFCRPDENGDELESKKKLLRIDLGFCCLKLELKSSGQFQSDKKVIRTGAMAIVAARSVSGSVKEGSGAKSIVGTHDATPSCRPDSLLRVGGRCSVLLPVEVLLHARKGQPSVDKGLRHRPATGVSHRIESCNIIIIRAQEK